MAFGKKAVAGVFVWKDVARAGAYIPCGHRLRSVGSVAVTKLSGAVKGATLLQLASLSADASQGPYGIYAPARASVSYAAIVCFVL